MRGECDSLGVASGFDEVDASEGQGAAEEFGPGAAFTKEEDAKERGGNGEEVIVGSKLRDFEIAEEPEIEEIGECGAEESHIDHGGPCGPGDGEPARERAEGDGAMDGDGKNEKRAEEKIVGGHGEGVVAGGDALAEYGVESEAQRADESDEIAEECGGMLGGVFESGEEDDAEERDGHAKGFAECGGF